MVFGGVWLHAVCGKAGGGGGWVWGGRMVYRVCGTGVGVVYFRYRVLVFF